ncbi:unnamed protein product [Spodoptera exigua]|nr:unnamed protein product [Spodoptera exigua]
MIVVSQADSNRDRGCEARWAHRGLRRRTELTPQSARAAERPRNDSSAAISSHYPTVTYRRQKWICLCKNNDCRLQTAFKENWIRMRVNRIQDGKNQQIGIKLSCSVNAHSLEVPQERLSPPYLIWNVNKKIARYSVAVRAAGGRLSAPARDVTALTTPGSPQWPFSEGADAPAPLSAAHPPHPYTLTPGHT